ncbi:hypothetical protein [Desulfonatronum thioautotrophicum]|uniref:hypothetical protein n=1 Tax=Desulfonatronum thioautotrophicum TaxID=617001 RepID=UPI0005EB1098|nr:hypothetical protein [Desulfonatronum thioautotrophicum]
MLELHFTCPTHDMDFRSAQWSLDTDLEIITTTDGSKKLLGNVHAPCPLCHQTHTYAPNELPCPLQAPNTNQEPNSRPSES